MSDAGGPKVGLMNIGEEAKPRFAVLPDPSSLLLNRSKRLAALAPKQELELYLRFLAGLTRAQHDVQPDLSQPVLLPFERIGQALEHGMPPVSRGLFEPDDAVQHTIDRLLSRLTGALVTPETELAIRAVRDASSRSGAR